MTTSKELADKISFRLLATNDHEDYEWLVRVLTLNTQSNDSISKL